MKTPYIYRCTQTITMQSDNSVSFTAGQLYRGHPSADPGGDWLMLFKNDQGEDHGIGADWLREYFSLVEEGAEVVETYEDYSDDYNGFYDDPSFEQAYGY